MPLPINYVAATNMQEVFLYQGEPIDGYVFSYSNTNPAEPKSLYSQKTLLPLTNPANVVGGLLVSAPVGGDIVKPIYRLTDDEGNFDTYKIEIRLNDGVTPETGTLIQTLDDWPPVGEGLSPEAVTNSENFVKNGQFRWNTTPSEEIGGLTGLIQQAVTPIASGNWEFIRDEGSTAVDHVTFFRYPQYVADPLESPRYACDVANTVPDATNLRKDLSIRWNDVNKFASDSQVYTFGFQAQTLDGSARSVEVVLIKNYGTGGTVSPTEEFIIATFQIQPTMEIFSLSFVFGIPAGSLIGSNNDDFVQLCIRFPRDNAFSIRSTNFVLFQGALIISSFPTTTSRDFLVRSGFNDVEPVDNYNLYLKHIRTANGFNYDYSELGRIEARIYSGDMLSTPFDPDSNLIFADGSSVAVEMYSPLGVPMRRLWERVIFDPIQGANLFGNGDQFFDVSTQLPTSQDYILLSPNQLGTGTVAVNFSSPFSFAQVADGAALSTFGYRTYLCSSNANPAGATSVAFIGLPTLISATPVTSPTVGTVPGLLLFISTLTGAPKFVFTFNNGGGAVGLAGTYFRYWDGSNTAYYVWYRVDGAGVDPAPGGFGIRCDLLSSYGNDKVAIATLQTVQGEASSDVIFTSGATVNPSDYWLLNGLGLVGDYTVWYQVNGLGVDPDLPGRTSIMVSLTGAETAAEVQFKTRTALNSVYYALPDYRGVFLKGGGNQFIEDNLLFSASGIAPFLTNMPYQVEEFASHNHNYVFNNLTFDNAAGVGQFVVTSNPTIPTSNTGGFSTRPTNSSVFYFIRY